MVLDRQPPPVVLHQIAALGDAQQSIVGLVVVTAGEIGIVGGDNRQLKPVGELQQMRLDIDLVREAVALNLDIEPVRKQARQCPQSRVSEFRLPLAQRPVDGAVGTAGQRDQPVVMRSKIRQLDVRAFEVARTEMGAAHELEQARIAPLVHGKERHHAVVNLGAARRLGGRRRSLPARLLEGERKSDTRDRLDAGGRDLVRKFEDPEQIVGIRQPDRGKAVTNGKLGELADGHCAFQQRIGRMDTQMDEGRRSPV